MNAPSHTCCQFLPTYTVLLGTQAFGLRTRCMITTHVTPHRLAHSYTVIPSLSDPMLAALSRPPACEPPRPPACGGVTGIGDSRETYNSATHALRHAGQRPAHPGIRYGAECVIHAQVSGARSPLSLDAQSDNDATARLTKTIGSSKPHPQYNEPNTP